MKVASIFLQACFLLIASHKQHVAAEKLMTTQPPITMTMIVSSSSSSSGSDISSSSDSISGSMETSTDSSDRSTIALTSTGTDTLPTSANTIPFVCPPLVVDVFADPNNCHRFYFCVFGTQLSMECDDDKMFNPYAQSCDVVNCRIGSNCRCP